MKETKKEKVEEEGRGGEKKENRNAALAVLDRVWRSSRLRWIGGGGQAGTCRAKETGEQNRGCKRGAFRGTSNLTHVHHIINQLQDKPVFSMVTNGFKVCHGSCSIKCPPPRKVQESFRSCAV